MIIMIIMITTIMIMKFSDVVLINYSIAIIFLTRPPWYQHLVANT